VANGRAGRKGKGYGRDPGGFVALPWSVLDSDAYRNLSPNARALLLEVARQYHGDDNGRLMLGEDYLAPRGWTSNDMITKGKRELLENKLIFETVMGHRPNKASWYAVTWQALDRLHCYDVGATEMFERGAYRTVPPKPRSSTRNTSAARAARSKRLTPSDGAESLPIAPSNGVRRSSLTPSHGAIYPLGAKCSTPSDGHPLEVPSEDAAMGVL